MDSSSSSPPPPVVPVPSSSSSNPENILTPGATAKMIMEKGKKGTGTFITSECVANGGKSEYLDILLDVLLNPEEPINDSETIDWCKWLVSGGRTPSEFSSIGELFFEIFFLSVDCEIS